MQYVPVEAVLEMSAIFSGFVFALIAIGAVYHYSQDIRFRRWAMSMVLFWTAFFPSNVFMDSTYLGDFISSLFRVFGSVLVLRAFGFKPFRNLSSGVLHTTIFVLLGLSWTPIVLLDIPNTTSAILSSALMAFSFSFAAYEILTFEHDKTRVWKATGLSYVFWAISSIPMILLPFIPEVVLFGYLQFIGQCFVLVTMLFSFFSSITRRLERNLKLTEITGSLITHDLRNFLNVTYGALNLVEPSNDESAEMIQVARDTIEDASQFIKDVRTSLLESDAYSTSMSDIDLTKLVEKVINRVKREHKLDDDQIILKTQEPVSACTTPMMAEVVWNIIDNGVKHAINTPEITITIHPYHNPVISIADKSGGMSRSLKEKLLSSDSTENNLGLGHMLIREISKVCTVGMMIEDRVERDTIIGTIFNLEFPAAGGLPSEE
jgi:signal transduction histidine kinase